MTNLKILRAAFEGTSSGDGRAFVSMMSDDVRWHIIGSTSWSRSFEGRASVINDLLRPLSAEFDGPNIVVASRFIGTGRVIAVEGENRSVTKRGEHYPNRYCWVFTFKDRKVVEIVEYCDTALIERVLQPLGDPS